MHGPRKCSFRGPGDLQGCFGVDVLTAAEGLIFCQNLIAVGTASLLINIMCMGLDGAGSDEQLLTDRLLALCLEKQNQDLLLPLGQLISEAEVVKITLGWLRNREFLAAGGIFGGFMEVRLGEGVAENGQGKAQIHQILREIPVVDLGPWTAELIQEEDDKRILRQNQNTHAQKIQEDPLQYTLIKRTFRTAKSEDSPEADDDDENLCYEIVDKYHPAVFGNHGRADQQRGIHGDEQTHVPEGKVGNDAVQSKQKASQKRYKIYGFHRGRFQEHSVINPRELRDDLRAENDGIIRQIDNKHDAQRQEQGTPAPAVKEVDTAGGCGKHDGQDYIVKDCKKFSGQ